MPRREKVDAPSEDSKIPPGDLEDMAPPEPGEGTSLPGWAQSKPKRKAGDPAVIKSVADGLYGLIDLAHDQAAKVTGFEGFRIDEKEQGYFRRLSQECAKYLGIEILPVFLILGVVVIIEAGKLAEYRKWRRGGGRRAAGTGQEEDLEMGDQSLQAALA